MPPTVVRVTLWVSVVAVMASLALGIGLLVDPGLSWDGWDSVSVAGQSIAEAGFVPALVGTALILALNVALVVGLVEQKRWAQFLAIVAIGGSALDGLLKLMDGRVNFAAPFLLALAWALYKERAWFGDGTPGAGQAAPS